MRSLLALLFMTLAWLPIVGPAAAAPPPSALAPAIDALATKQGLSGTILVTERGRPFYRRSFGLADRAFAVPMAADTRFKIASITKLVTAVLVLQLHQEGKLDVDRPAGTYLPALRGRPAGRVTIHQLLNHTSGLAQWDDVASYQEAFEKGVEKYQRPLAPAVLVERCCTGPLAGTPGAAFSYNNADYFLLGAIVEALTGKSYEAALAERILRPLGMKDSGLLRWDAIVPRLAPSYFKRPDTGALIAEMPFYWGNGYAAAAIYSDVDDVAAFADALYGGRLLKPLALARLLAPGLDDYGYGLWSYSFTRGGRTWRVAKRPGSVMGANAVLYRLLDRDVSIILLANTNAADLDVLAQRIADLLVR